MAVRMSIASSRRRFAGAMIMLAAMGLGCSETPTPTDPGTTPPPPPPLAASPFAISAPVQGASARATLTLSDPPSGSLVTYVSLPPNAIPGGTTASIRVPRTGATVTTGLIGGGFDPVAITALAGDTLTIVIEVSGGGPKTFTRLVPASAPPIVIRSDPPSHKRDVPLNSIILIVFSQPIDSSTVNSTTVRLWRGSTPVAGTVRLADAAHLRAEFHPDTLLAAQTDYELLLGQGIRDVSGSPLHSVVAVPFTTGAVSVVYSITGTVTGLAGAGLVLHLDTGENLPVAANGPVAFASPLATGTSYRVTVGTLPTNPAQLCIVTRGEGVIDSADVAGVAITCSGVDPSLSGQILFTSMRDPAPHIYRLDLDRLTITQLTSGPNMDYTPQWSPDRSRIAFTRESPSFAPGLLVMRADGSGVIQAIPIGTSFGRTFTWSPDGSRLAVFDGSSFVMVDAAGGGEISRRESIFGSYMYGNPAWAPDGLTIAFFGDPPSSGLDWFFQVLLMDADGSNVRRFTSPVTYGFDSTASVDYAERTPAWSPDGMKLVFWSIGYGLTVANRDGTGGYSVSHDDFRHFNGLPPDYLADAYPDWSPDGTHIVYQMNGQLFVTMADGSGTPRQLTSVPGGAFQPAWLK